MTELTPEQVAELQHAYRDLINYEGDDPFAPIDPLTYRATADDRLIHIAAFRGDAKTVEWLLDAGEEINATGDMGSTPAHYAGMGQHRHIYELLESRGADMTILDEFGKTPPETWVFCANRPDG